MRTGSLARRRQIFAINGKALAGFLFAFLGWLMWPGSYEWWQFAFMSMLIILAALSSFIQSIILMFKLYEHDKAIASVEAIGSGPKSSQMADNDRLEQADMFQ